MSSTHTNEPILNILEVLRKHSDSEHTLTQKQIREYIEKETGECLDRETVKRNLRKLLDSELPVYAMKEDPSITGLYYEHDFTDGELRLLINSVLFVDGLSDSFRHEMIGKLEKLSNKYFHSTISKIDMAAYDNIENMDVLVTIENIDYAISEDKQLEFHYCDCSKEGKLYLKTENNEVKRYVVSPYQIVSQDGHSYLLCYCEAHGEYLSHFRIDRIKDSNVLSDQPRKQLRKLKGFEGGIRLSKYLKEHPNMWAGEPVHITFDCDRKITHDVLYKFGTSVNIEEISETIMRVRVYASEESMFHWALQYLDRQVEIISPESTRIKMLEALENICENYNIKIEKRKNKKKGSNL